MAERSVVLITDDERGIASALGASLCADGQSVVLVGQGGAAADGNPGRMTVDLGNVDAVGALVAALRDRCGPVGSLIHLRPLASCPAFATMDVHAWRDRVRKDVKSLFYLARAAAPDLRSAAGSGRLMAATGLGRLADGDAASSGFPGHAGLAGLVKSIAQEWPEIRVAVLHLDPDERPARLAELMRRELAVSQGSSEYLWAGERRLRLHARLEPLFEETAHLAVGPDWVILLTGGARGITAEVACHLAEHYRPTLVLFGRTPPPPAVEDARTAGRATAREIKAALMDGMREDDRPITPAAVEAAYGRLVREREIRERLVRMRALGARVDYRCVDVRDPVACAHAVEAIYTACGRLDGVIHGAGVIEDKLLVDKSPESFDRVFDTKADSAFILSRLLRPETLRFLVFFASVAGRFGNRGQADYAAANEVLNALAIHLDRRWPARVVAVNWGPWDGTGMVTDEVRRQFLARGVRPVPMGTGPALLDAELRLGKKGQASVIIGDGPWREAEWIPPTRSAGLPLLEGVALRPQPGSGFAATLMLEPGRHRYLLDHQLDGRPVLPAAMAMEMMAECAQAGWGDWTVMGISDLRVLRGIVLGDDPVAITLQARPTGLPPAGASEWSIDMEIGAGDRDHRPFYRAVIRLARRLPDPPRHTVPPPGALPPFPLPVEDAYRLWLFHGPSFQCIRALGGIDGENLVATVSASEPASCLGSAQSMGWVLDPVLIDSAPQLAILWARARFDLTPLPSRVARLTRFAGPAEAELRCHFRLAPDAEPSTVRADAVFVRADGSVALLIEGLECTGSNALNRLAGISAVRPEGGR